MVGKFASVERCPRSLNTGKEIVAGAAVVEAGRVVVAVVMVATMLMVLVSPLTLYRPSATVLQCDQSQLKYYNTA